MESKRSNKVKSFVIYALCVAVLVLLDQYTKIVAVNALKGKKAFSVIEGVFEFNYLENTGAAWGMMSGARVFFIILTIVIVLALSYAVIRMPYNKRMLPLRIICIVITAGAIGNFIDRLILGYVRDFIYFKLIDFPVFNVADIYVTVSVIIFAVMVLFVYKEEDFAFLKKNNN